MSPGLADVARGVVLDGRYRIEDVIGHGGMSTVYRAHDEVLDRDVAVKLFPPTPDGDESLRHQAEMRVLARLSHPNLVTLHDAGSAFAGRAAPQTYLVMELVPGPTLADLLATGPLSERQTARVGRQLAEALTAVHEADVVHRDIKPANVLLVRRETAEPDAHPDAHTTGPLVKIADFGIARLTDGARLTMTGTTMGTATYLSPEQASGAEVGPPTDVYALGLVLLECLTGRKAFTGTVMEVAAARLTHDPVIPTALGRRWCDVLEAMTRRDPLARLTMAEVAERLDEIALSDDQISGPQDVRSGAASREDADDGVPTAAHAVEVGRPADPVPGTSSTDAASTGVSTGPVSTSSVSTSPASTGAVSTGPQVSGPVRTGPAVVPTPQGRADGATRRLRTSGILALARSRARPGATDGAGHGTGPAGLPHGDDRAAVPTVRPSGTTAGSSGPTRPGLTAVLALTTLVLLVTVGVLVSRGGGPTTQPPVHPEIEGELGRTLDELAESVVP